ncbi:hypothetical protein RND71_024980 [Anisodus tanguticus]|uniref:Uncharacterized protein n=1 Tax=Anisodus tanguticus TaxID=243964 RepID=A0AAE1RP50_9SOLA|nr:hypothetical protein RND71_024980 [Anisodus tanguticus]
MAKTHWTGVTKINLYKTVDELFRKKNEEGIERIKDRVSSVYLPLCGLRKRAVQSVKRLRNKIRRGAARPSRGQGPLRQSDPAGAIQSPGVQKLRNVEREEGVLLNHRKKEL